MRLDWVFVSKISLDADCHMGFPSSVIVLYFLSAAVGLFLTVFFWLECRFGAHFRMETVSMRWYIVRRVLGGFINVFYYIYDYYF